MTLYHGSNMAVMEPKLVARTRTLDFGDAFYLTSDFVLAARWAKSAVRRRGEGEAFVSVFEVDERDLMSLEVMKFTSPDAGWLRYVTSNRAEDFDELKIDVVIGPVANDNTMPVLNLYFKGAYSEDEALRRLMTQKLRDQYAFKTMKAISLLKFVEAKKL